MNDLIALPSGLILSTAPIAWITPEGGLLVVTFTVGSATDPLRLTLDAADSAALLEAMTRRGKNAAATRKALEARPAA